ncbi:MAG: GNAT family N-acetyltransferase [Armatimonadetes bacterium]|nr:GNAT family N-acetyltransferase [Armatimonadota bacterium]
MAPGPRGRGHSLLSATEYTISFDPGQLQRDRMYEYLSRSYWSPNIRRDVFDRQIDHSFCVGAYLTETGEQIGFARLVTDYGRFAYLADVYVLPEYQGKGIAQAMVGGLIEHDRVKTVGHWILATKDAHTLYEKFGFEATNERYMFMRKSMERWQEAVSPPTENAS